MARHHHVVGLGLDGSAIAHVVQQHRVAGLRRHLRDARAHDPRAHHQHLGVLFLEVTPCSCNGATCTQTCNKNVKFSVGLLP